MTTLLKDLRPSDLPRQLKLKLLSEFMKNMDHPALTYPDFMECARVDRDMNMLLAECHPRPEVGRLTLFEQVQWRIALYPRWVPFTQTLMRGLAASRRLNLVEIKNHYTPSPFQSKTKADVIEFCSKITSNKYDTELLIWWVLSFMAAYDIGKSFPELDLLATRIVNLLECNNLSGPSLESLILLAKSAITHNRILSKMEISISDANFKLFITPTEFNRYYKTNIAMDNPLFENFPVGPL